MADRQLAEVRGLYLHGTKGAGIGLKLALRELCLWLEDWH